MLVQSSGTSVKEYSSASYFVFGCYSAHTTSQAGESHLLHLSVPAENKTKGHQQSNTRTPKIKTDIKV